MIVACLGDSITAGSPLWDPDPVVRGGIAEPDVRSQWLWWAAQRDPELELRNHGVYGERTDEIARRLEAAALDADVLIVQGGINDIAQHRPVRDAARNLAAMLGHARDLGLRAAIADVLPWNNGDDRAAADILRLNAILQTFEVPLLPFHDTLVDPAQPLRMRDGLSDDGDHPSIEGHRLLGERALDGFRDRVG